MRIAGEASTQPRERVADAASQTWTAELVFVNPTLPRSRCIRSVASYSAADGS